jgi:hypothetical protein
MPLGICRAEEILTFLSVKDHSLAYPHYAFAQEEKAKWSGGKRSVTRWESGSPSSARQRTKSSDLQSKLIVFLPILRKFNAESFTFLLEIPVAGSRGISSTQDLLFIVGYLLSFEFNGRWL